MARRRRITEHGDGRVGAAPLKIPMLAGSIDESAGLP